jgi:hypothetical protein
VSVYFILRNTTEHKKFTYWYPKFFKILQYKIPDADAYRMPCTTTIYVIGTDEKMAQQDDLK